jgi:glycine/D-amino acid oxidase-like deaminating enzyme
MANTADVIIIGGGIIGNAIAYYLAKKGTDVIVLEGSDHIGNGGSSRNGGGPPVRTRPERASSCYVWNKESVAIIIRGT